MPQNTQAQVSEPARPNDAAKQEPAEALPVQTPLIDTIMAKYGRAPAIAPMVAEAVLQGAKASGLDLDAMTLTEAGFVPAN